jgi:hypothetical protein
MDNIPITIDEHIKLLDMAPLNTVIETVRGPKFIALAVTENNEWAIKHLAFIRGVNL